MHSRIKPNLVSHKMIKKIGKILHNPVKDEPTWRDNLNLFYNEYIRPNLFAIIVFFLVAVFLTIKYLLKQEKEETEIKHKKNRRKHKQQKKIEDDTEVIDFQMPYDIKYDIKYHTNDVEYNDVDIYNNNNNRRIYADDEESIDEDEVSFYSLRKDHERALKNNDGYSSMMMEDELNQKKTKMTFNELAKLVSGN